MQDRKPTLPPKARLISELEIIPERTIQGNRTVAAYRKKHGNFGLFFLKNNPENTRYNDLLLELEALVCAFYNFYSPSLTPRAHLYYDKPKTGNLYSKLATSELKDFLNLKEDKIRMCDIVCDRKAPEVEKQRVRNNVKGLACILTLTALIFRGDDLNKKNISKDGRRTDFGMAFWWVQSIYTSVKENRPVNYKITAETIRHFPCMSGEMPYHFPGPTSTVMPDGLLNFILDNTRFWDSAYRPEEKQIFALLADNNEFHFYKYLMLTQFQIIGTAALHAQIPLYMSEESILNSPQAGDRRENIIQIIDQALEGIKNNLREVLLTMPEYKAFLELHQTDVEEMITNELESWNKRMQEKIQKHPELQNEYESCLVDIEQVKNNLLGLAREVNQIESIKCVY